MSCTHIVMNEMGKSMYTRQGAPYEICRGPSYAVNDVLAVRRYGKPDANSLRD